MNQYEVVSVMSRDKCKTEFHLECLQKLISKWCHIGAGTYKWITNVIESY